MIVKKYIYITHGICPSSITISIGDDKIISYQPNRGCPGNSIGMDRLLKNMSIDEAIKKLTGIKCGAKKSSCPDQIAQALMEIKSGKLLPVA
jgi:uncharacterized protein (TIGR03905 family)